MCVNGTIDPADVLLAAIQSGPVTVMTSGHSMAPHLDGGRKVRIESGRARFGDLMAYVNPIGTVVVHRYVATWRGEFIVLGDANPRFDTPVPSDRVLGRVTAIDDQGSPPRHRWFLCRRVIRLLPRELRAKVSHRRG